MKEAERSFADLEWENKKHKTRREKLLERMEVLTPSSELCVIDHQVAEVQQPGVTVTGRGGSCRVQRSVRIMLVVKYRTAAGRLTAS